MIDATVRTPSHDEPMSSPVRRRPLWSRLSAGHVVMLLAGLLAFLLVLLALRDRDRTAHVAVAAGSIEQGTIVRAGSIAFRSVNVEDAELVAAFVDGDEMQAHLDGFAVAARSIPEGSVLLDTDLRSGDVGTGLRAMSLELPAGRAVAGAIETGDRVDIFEVTEIGSEAVAVDLGVVAAGDESSLGFGSDAATLTVAVDAPTALRLAHALSHGDVYVVRANGAPQMTAGTIYRVDDA